MLHVINRIKFLPPLLFFLYAIAFSQQVDSLRVTRTLISADTLKKNQKDTVSVVDSVKAKTTAKPDTIISIFQRPLGEDNSFINRRDIDFMDYRYAGDLLKDLSLNFSDDYGTIGQPNETFLYGAGNNAVGYFEDGILQNNRLLNYFDLNNIQTEDIDSIEIAPLPRGFLYGSFNNPVAVNFISRDFISPKPYTRIKYYQGPNGEAMIDGIFSQKLSNKFNVLFDFTNRKFDATYHNSQFSEWLLKFKLKYYLNDKINLTGSYNFENSKVGLYGGVNVDSLNSAGLDVNQNLYSTITAPVNFNSRDQNYKFHYFNLKMFSTYFDNSLTDLNFYYKFDYTELNQQVPSYYKTVNQSKIYGVSFRHDYTKDILDFQINGNYEVSNIHYYTLTDSMSNYYPVKYNNLSASTVLSLHLLDSTLVPSIFYKYLNESGNDDLPALNGSYSGMGADISLKASDFIKLYFGYSTFKTNVQSNFSQNFEAGVTLKPGSLFANLKLFKRKDFNPDKRYQFINYADQINPDLTGIGVNINYTIWKFLVETQTSYYTSNNSTELFYLFPKVNFTGGVYYKNILFNDNLNLKTGVIYSYMGKRNSNVGELSSNWKLDFTAAGEIQKVAMVYFSWENLFDNQYYIIPYFPMYRRGIRFGIAWELFN